MLQDLRFAFRTFLKDPGFALVVVLTLALGIGANTAVFSVVNAVLLRPLPFPDPPRLAFLWETFPGSDRGAVSVPNLQDWRKQSDVFESIEAYDARSLSLRGKNSPERVAGTASTAGFLAMLGTRPFRGRLFLPEEDRGVHRIAILGENLWRRAFAADPTIVGKSLELDGVAHTIVGIVPDIPFGFLFRGEQTELWVPLDLLSHDAARRSAHRLRSLGRLRPGVSIEQARQQLRTIGTRMAQDYSEQKGRNIFIRPALEEVVGNARTELFVVLAAVGLVLLIACANIANMLLARATGRRRELAVRVAIGAGRRRIMQQLLTEALLLSFLGAAIGVVLAAWAMPVLTAGLGAWLPRASEIRLDSGVLLFSGALAITTGIVFGVIPASQISRSNLHETLKEGGRQGSAGGRHGSRSLLVIFELALSVMLLIGAALLAKSFAHLREVPLGFDPGNVLTMRITLPESTYPDPGTRTIFYSRVLAKLAAIPGVRFAGAATLLPVDSWGMSGNFEVEGRPPFPPEREPSVEHRAASAEVFRALGIPLLEGRYFTEADTPNSPRSAILNRAMADRYFPGESPLGKRLRFRSQEYYTVVGIVANVHQAGPSEAPMPEVYAPYSQVESSALTQRMSFALRTTGNPVAIAPAVRQALAEVNPALAISNLITLDSIVGGSFADRRLSLLLVGSFAALALLLGLIGIHGVLSYSVRQRVQEIGIRMALGAQRRQVMGMFLWRGVALALLGILAGLVGAFALTRLMASLLYGVRPNDPAIFALVPTILLASAALAAYLPARRATKIDPLIALRYE